MTDPQTPALLEARIARRVTANWTKIKQSKVTPLEVAQDIVRALAETHALAADRDADALREAAEAVEAMPGTEGEVDMVMRSHVLAILDRQL